MMLILAPTTDGERVAEVRSHSRPNTWYTIRRFGRRKDEGGTGTKWLCACPSRYHPCKHLERLWARDYAVGDERLTALGEQLLPSREEKQRERDRLEREFEERRVKAAQEGRPILYTIGHGSRELDGFIAQLCAVGVRMLVDVRTFPSSRWSKQFDRTNLNRPGALGSQIAYRHMPELGGYNRDKTLRTQDENWRAGIKWLADRCRRETIALMCMETDPYRCHRNGTIEPALRQASPDLEIVHLLSPTKAPGSTSKSQLGLGV